jgi:hypothetical protein
MNGQTRFRRDLPRPLRGRPAAMAHLQHGAEALGDQISQGRFQRGMALIATTLSVLSGGEAYFEHTRGSFNQRWMWTPVWVTPPMVAAGIGALCSERIARVVLPAASLVNLAEGLVGAFLHLRGIYRMPGRFRNFRFNFTMGPPLFAPLLFSAVGLLGLIATLFRRQEL